MQASDWLSELFSYTPYKYPESGTRHEGDTASFLCFRCLGHFAPRCSTARTHTQRSRSSGDPGTPRWNPSSAKSSSIARIIIKLYDLNWASLSLLVLERGRNPFRSCPIKAWTRCSWCKESCSWATHWSQLPSYRFHSLSPCWSFSCMASWTIIRMSSICHLV